jgi:CPA2 family monovalent cation:H+ antiporter-2
MAADFGGQGLKDALVILGAAGVVIPAFARLKISPVIGFIIVGMIVGPFGLGALAQDHAWLRALTITDRSRIEPFAEFGIILLLFSIGLDLSFRRLWGMRRLVFRVGAVEFTLVAIVIGALLFALGETLTGAVVLGLALSNSSMALVLPLVGSRTPVGRSVFAMLLIEDLAIVPVIFALGAAGRGAAGGLSAFGVTVLLGVLVVVVMMVVGRVLLPRLFAQAARTKSPELFLSTSLVVVIAASFATAAVGLSPIVGALVAGILIAETEYQDEVEVITAPFRGLALGIFLITVGMSIDFRLISSDWIRIGAALLAVLAIKIVVTSVILRTAGRSTRGVAVEAGILMASPSEMTLVVIAAASAAGVISSATASFWQIVTAMGLTLTPLLARLGRHVARRVEGDEGTHDEVLPNQGERRAVIIGFGRVGRMIAEMLSVHGKPFVAVDSSVDIVKGARAEGFPIIFGDAARPELLDRLNLGHATALILTMDDPVQAVRLVKKVRSWRPELPIISRARDPEHAARLYKAGVTDAVPETVEASLQLAEAVLVDVGAPMGPVIASIHEKRAELRSEIMAEGELQIEPRLGRRRLGDADQAPAAGSNRSTPAE